MKHSDFLLLKQETWQVLRRNKELLSVNQYPLLDKEFLNEIMSDGCKKEFFDVFDTCLINDLNLINESYKNRDWIRVLSMAEKMVETASFATVRLYVAFLLLQGYLTLGYSTLKEALYAQAMQVSDDTLTEFAVNKPLWKKSQI